MRRRDEWPVLDSIGQRLCSALGEYDGDPTEMGRRGAVVIHSHPADGTELHRAECLRTHIRLPSECPFDDGLEMAQASTIRKVSEEPIYPTRGVISYDPKWSEMYRQLATGLSAALGGWRTQHIGSTSVPGLAAKPVIDIAARVPTGFSARDRTASLLARGWTAPDTIGSHDCSFRLDGKVRTAIVHFFAEAAWPTAHQRLFAAWLREHPEDRDAYGALKQQLSSGGVWGAEYTRAKTNLIQQIVDRACAAEGLPSISIWDRD